MSVELLPRISPGSLAEAAARLLDDGHAPRAVAQALRTTVAHLGVLLPGLDLASAGGGWHRSDAAAEVAAFDALAAGEESITSVAGRLGLPVEHVQRLRRMS